MVESLAARLDDWRALVNSASVFRPDDVAAARRRDQLGSAAGQRRDPGDDGAGLPAPRPLGGRAAGDPGDRPEARQPQSRLLQLHDEQARARRDGADAGDGRRAGGPRLRASPPARSSPATTSPTTRPKVSHRLNLLGRRTGADEVAEAALFLATGPLASGQTLFVDSGQHLLAQPRDVMYLARAMKRHALSTRLWHWVNALSLIVLFMSGLNISNAHPHLYWGEWGFAPKDAWLHVVALPRLGDDPRLLQPRRGARLARAVRLGLRALAAAVHARGAAQRPLPPRHRHRAGRTGGRRAVWADVRAHLRLEFEHARGQVQLPAEGRLRRGAVRPAAADDLHRHGDQPGDGRRLAVPASTCSAAGRARARSTSSSPGRCSRFFVLHVVLVLLNRPAQARRAR